MRFADVPGDLELLPDGSDFVYSSGARLGAERLRSGFGTGRTSWKYDLRRGFPYREVIEMFPDFAAMQMLVGVWLAKFDFVFSVDEVTVTFDRDARELRIGWRVTTDQGAIVDVQNVST